MVSPICAVMRKFKWPKFRHSTQGISTRRFITTTTIALWETALNPITRSPAPAVSAFAAPVRTCRFLYIGRGRSFPTDIPRSNFKVRHYRNLEQILTQAAALAIGSSSAKLPFCGGSSLVTLREFASALGAIRQPEAGIVPWLLE